MWILPSQRNGIFAPEPASRRRTGPSRRLRNLYNLALFVGSSCLVAPVAADATGDLVATFTSGAITRADVEAVIAQRLPVQRELLAQPGAVRSLVESLLRYDLLVREAETRGYRDDLRVRMAARAKANELLLRAQASVEPHSLSTTEVDSAYAAQRRDFSRPVMRRASHVLLQSKAEASALIAELQGAARDRFARAATDKSQDPNTKNQGGELGYFDKEGKTERGTDSAAAPQLVAAAFKLRAVGAITPHPIELPNGFSVLMLTGEMPAYETPRAQADERIRDQLAEQQSKAKTEALVAALREEHKPSVNASLVDLIVMPPVEPARIPSGFPAAPPDPREPPKIVEPDGI
jgi:peptidyl-prolyl cis-trans isomerase C